MKKHPIRITVAVRKGGQAVVRTSNGSSTTTKRIRLK